MSKFKLTRSICPAAPPLLASQHQSTQSLCTLSPIAANTRKSADLQGTCSSETAEQSQACSSTIWPGKSVCTEETASAPRIDSWEHVLFLNLKEGNKVLDEQIWRSTEWYLREIRRKMRERSVEEMMQLMSRESDLSWDKFALLLHGVQVSSAFPLSKPSKRSNKTHSKANSLSHNYKSDGRRHKLIKNNGDFKAKTGRKPLKYECFLCAAAVGYKVELIQHLQTSHNLNKSQSLLYKRINQGPATMRRLYDL